MAAMLASKSSGKAASIFFRNSNFFGKQVMTSVLDQIVSSVNASAADPILFRSGDTISLTDTFIHTLRCFFSVPHRRLYVVFGMTPQASANIVVRDMDEQTSVESLPVFSALLSQLGEDGRNEASLPVVLMSSDPFHFGVFLQPLPWMKQRSVEGVTG